MTETNLDRRIAELQQQRKQVFETVQRVVNGLIADLAVITDDDKSLERAETESMIGRLRQIQKHQRGLHAIKESLRAISSGL